MPDHAEQSEPYLTEDPMWNPALRALPIPGIRRMVNMAAEMDDVIHLSLGQPDFATPQHIIDEHVRALRAGQTGYTMDAGLPELLTALKEYYRDRFDREIVEENILVTTGATEAIYLALSATAAPGRQFLLPDPCFPLFAPLIRMNGGEVKAIPTRAEHGHQLDPQQVIDSIGMRTFAIVLNSPSNPTGTVYPRETVEAIVQEAAYRGVKVISDEVYDHVVLDGLEYPSVINCTADLDHVMAISSFSKTFSMPGLRIGWVVSSQGVIKMLRRYHIFTTTVANTPAQWAGVAALKGDQSCVDEMVAEYQRRRDRVVQLVAETPHLSGYMPQGAFYIFPSLPANTDGTNVAIRLLKETGVCTVPGDTFGDSCPNSLRISYSTSMDKIEAAFERMIPWFAKQRF
ncbi:MAG: aminotransferase class I/II-fold pyridoxal phosphate-dependent enzyme [Gammaproteobacteria bacterium]|jgi:aspartate/methionine/tyrosine aminotransferase